MTVKCSDVAGIPRKVLKPYISDFCKNYVYNQPGDVGGNDMEYTLIGPWNQWKLKLTWSTKQLWADRSCEANYQAMASKAGCGSFRTKRRKVVVATKAGGEEHAGPETCEFSRGPFISFSSPLSNCLCDKYRVLASCYGTLA